MAPLDSRLAGARLTLGVSGRDSLALALRSGWAGATRWRSPYARGERARLAGARL